MVGRALKRPMAVQNGVLIGVSLGAWFVPNLRGRVKCCRVKSDKGVITFAQTVQMLCLSGSSSGHCFRSTATGSLEFFCRSLKWGRTVKNTASWRDFFRFARSFVLRSRSQASPQTNQSHAFARQDRPFPFLFFAPALRLCLRGLCRCVNRCPSRFEPAPGPTLSFF